MTIDIRNDIDNLIKKLREAGDEFLIVVKPNKDTLPDCYKQIGVILPFAEFSANGKENIGHWQSTVEVNIIDSLGHKETELIFEEESIL